MDKDALIKHLQALASGKETGNAPVVKAYLADKNAGKVAGLLARTTEHNYLGRTPLHLPSSCLPMLD